MGLVALGLLGLLLWRRHRQALLAKQPEVVARLALEDALAELDKAHKQLSKENCRPYAICVSGIVRRYIEHRFSIRAPHRSTEEFLGEAQRAPELGAKHKEKLGYFLQCCDFLKFARGYADVDELELLHQAAVIFVTETQFKPVSETPTSAQPQPKESKP
jgi:hypothetical protein